MSQSEARELLNDNIAALNNLGLTAGGVFVQVAALPVISQEISRDGLLELFKSSLLKLSVTAVPGG